MAQSKYTLEEKIDFLRKVRLIIHEKNAMATDESPDFVEMGMLMKEVFGEIEVDLVELALELGFKVPFPDTLNMQLVLMRGIRDHYNASYKKSSGPAKKTLLNGVVKLEQVISNLVELKHHTDKLSPGRLEPAPGPVPDPNGVRSPGAAQVHESSYTATGDQLLSDIQDAQDIYLRQHPPVEDGEDSDCETVFNALVNAKKELAAIAEWRDYYKKRAETAESILNRANDIHFRNEPPPKDAWHVETDKEGEFITNGHVWLRNYSGICTRLNNIDSQKEKP